MTKRPLDTGLLKTASKRCCHKTPGDTTPVCTTENRICSLTRYPEIYSGTYWGAFNRDNERDANKIFFREIISRRNTFIKNYNITRCVQKVPLYVQQEYSSKCILDRRRYPYFDHVEVYESVPTRDWVILSSPNL